MHITLWMEAIVRAIGTAQPLFLLAPLYVMVELLLPKGRVSWRSRLQSAVFTLSGIPTSVAVAMAFSRVWGPLGVHPLLILDLGRWLRPLGIFGPTLSSIAAFTIGDFFFYWMHRAQHRFFWRFHRVHHAIEELSVVSCYHHPSEELFRSLLWVIPTSLLIDVRSLPAALIIATMLNGHVYWIHSATALNYGPLRYFFNDNRFHRIHHSRNSEHFDKNFGGFCTIWDQLFGTAHFPAKDEWPDAGLHEMPEPGAVAEYYAAPFKRQPAPLEPLAGDARAS